MADSGMEGIQRQMKKGVMEILVLFLLKDNDLYGYQIIQELSRKSRGYFQIKEGTLYPVLYRLEDGGYIESYWEQPQEKRQVPRKFYRITWEGRDALKSMQNEWINFAYNVNVILN